MHAFVNLTVIRPVYLGDVHACFALHRWDGKQYVPFGKTFKRYQCAMLAWEAVKTNPQRRFWQGIRFATVFGSLFWLVIIALVLFLTGCANVRPLAEYQHQSHATQHFGSNRTNYGYDVVSAGIRWRPHEKVTVDLLEGYSMQEFQGRREVFTGRVQVEF